MNLAAEYDSKVKYLASKIDVKTDNYVTAARFLCSGSSLLKGGWHFEVLRYRATSPFLNSTLSLQHSGSIGSALHLIALGVMMYDVVRRAGIPLHPQVLGEKICNNLWPSKPENEKSKPKISVDPSWHAFNGEVLVKCPECGEKAYDPDFFMCGVCLRDPDKVYPWGVWLAREPNDFKPGKVWCRHPSLGFKVIALPTKEHAEKVCKAFAKFFKASFADYQPRLLDTESVSAPAEAPPAAESTALPSGPPPKTQEWVEVKLGSVSFDEDLKLKFEVLKDKAAELGCPVIVAEQKKSEMAVGASPLPPKEWITSTPAPKKWGIWWAGIPGSSDPEDTAGWCTDGQGSILIFSSQAAAMARAKKWNKGKKGAPYKAKAYTEPSDSVSEKPEVKEESAPAPVAAEEPTYGIYCWAPNVHGYWCSEFKNLTLKEATSRLAMMTSKEKGWRYTVAPMMGFLYGVWYTDKEHDGVNSGWAYAESGKGHLKGTFSEMLAQADEWNCKPGGSSTGGVYSVRPYLPEAEGDFPACEEAPTLKVALTQLSVCPTGKKDPFSKPKPSKALHYRKIWGVWYEDQKDGSEGWCVLSTYKAFGTRAEAEEEFKAREKSAKNHATPVKHSIEMAWGVWYYGDPTDPDPDNQAAGWCDWSEGSGAFRPFDKARERFYALHKKFPGSKYQMLVVDNEPKEVEDVAMPF